MRSFWTVLLACVFSGTIAHVLARYTTLTPGSPTAICFLVFTTWLMLIFYRQRLTGDSFPDKLQRTNVYLAFGLFTISFAGEASTREISLALISGLFGLLICLFSLYSSKAPDDVCPQDMKSS